MQELRSTGSRAEDVASEKDGTGREPTGSVRPKDERAAEEYSGGARRTCAAFEGREAGRKPARGRPEIGFG